jgi:hypothetical protein
METASGFPILKRVLWSSCILTPLHSLTGPVGQPFSSRPGGQRSGDAPTLLELGSPVSNVPLQSFDFRQPIEVLMRFIPNLLRDSKREALTTESAADIQFSFF